MEKKRINAYMKSHPDVKVFYFTTDELAFTNKGQAEAHQRTLTGKGSDVKIEKRAAQPNATDKAIEALMNKIDEAKAKLLDLEGAELAKQQGIVEALELELDKLGE